MIVVGFDSEYVFDDAPQRNHVLSYQYAVKSRAGMHTGIVYTEDGSKGSRWKLSELLSTALGEARRHKVVGTAWPKEVYACAHFTRADLAAFKDFPKLRTEFDSLRGSYSTITKPYSAKLYDASRNVHEVKVHLRDTMALSPGGTGLTVLGELLGLQKIELPRGYIERMDKLLKEDPRLFQDYAIRDAEIAAEYAWRMAGFSDAEGLGFEIPLTVGSLATKILKKLWDEKGLDRLQILGREVVKQTKRKQGKPLTSKDEVRLTEVDLHYTLATEAYHGGRNEAYMFGPTDDDFWTDVDLSGAYSTAMAAIKVPDWKNLKTTKNLQDFTKEKLGLARVSFEFPTDCEFPCLPVRTDHGLVFPLEGETFCGSPEIELARQMGATVIVLDGIVVPWRDDRRPFALFSEKVRAQRKAHPKGSVVERTWKEIGNSVYGKLAQGLREKRVFDSRSGGSQLLPESEITQPYLAAYITSLVRATLSELLTRIPTGKTVVSATTD